MVNTAAFPHLDPLSRYFARLLMLARPAEEKRRPQQVWPPLAASIRAMLFEHRKEFKVSARSIRGEERTSPVYAHRRAITITNDSRYLSCHSFRSLLVPYARKTKRITTELPRDASLLSRADHETIFISSSREERRLILTGYQDMNCGKTWPS